MSGMTGGPFAMITGICVRLGAMGTGIGGTCAGWTRAWGAGGATGPAGTLGWWAGPPHRSPGSTRRSARPAPGFAL